MPDEGWFPCGEIQRSKFDVLYAVATLERLGGSDEELENLRDAYGVSSPEKLQQGLSQLSREICKAVEIINNRWQEDGLLTPAARKDLSTTRPEIVEALEEVGSLIQPLPWPEPEGAGG